MSFKDQVESNSGVHGDCVNSTYKTISSGRAACERSAGGFAQFITLLFDSPRKSPIIRRKEFLKQILILLLRWIVCSLLIGVLLSGDFIGVERFVIAGAVLLLSLLVLLPYFFVLYRRLVGVGFPCPAPAVWLWALVYIALGIWAFLAAPAKFEPGGVDFLAIIAMVVPYLALLLCKDRTTA